MQLGNATEEIHGLHGELVGFYFDDLASGVSMTPAEVSEVMDGYGWTGGWRAGDSAEQAIWLGGCPDCAFQTLPVIFILQTSTMRIVEVNPIGVQDIIDIVEELDWTG